MTTQTPTKPSRSPLAADDKTIQKFLDTCHEALQTEGISIHPDNRRPISDVTDENGNEYVDLVMKGGGIWGIALVGFLYVLEENKIRFLRMAGASAGSIPATIMAAMGNPSTPKAKRLLAYLLHQDVGKFVDGHPLAKLWIGAMTSGPNFRKRVKNTILVLIALFLIALFGWFFRHMVPVDPLYLSYLLLTVFLIFGVVLFPVLVLLKRFNRAGMGINPGENFLFWIREILRHELDEPAPKLKTLLSKSHNFDEIPGLAIRKKEAAAHEFIQKIKQEQSALVVISSELVSGNKVEFPRMKDLFLLKGGANPFDDPAYMVRASMAIPFFFESFYVKNIHRESIAVQKAWQDYLGIPADQIPTEARLVDGGLLSNFPLSVFAETQEVDSLTFFKYPVIGVDLIEKESEAAQAPKTPYKPADRWSFFDFGLRMLSAARSQHDRSVIINSPHLRETIAQVPIVDISWLKFSITEKEKQQLFITGMKAATEFLTRFEQGEVIKIASTAPPSPKATTKTKYYQTP